ncbi:MAG: hypothetical protein IPP69_06180 [Flavobacteriales bacterium]|nr:hypothetical protein [Flavobacteriales bacterium]
MKTFSFKSGMTFLVLSMFALLFNSCTKEKVTDEISGTDLTPENKLEKMAPVNFITTSPSLSGSTFLFQRISVCNDYTNVEATSLGRITYHTIPNVTQSRRGQCKRNQLLFNLNEWVFITPPTTSGPQPPVNKILKFRYTSSAFNKSVTFSFNRNTGLWTIPASNGTWQASQINPSDPC